MDIIEDLPQIERIKRLLGTDEGFFLLSIVSYIERYCKDSLGLEKSDNFNDLIFNFSRDSGYRDKDRKISICRTIKSLHRETNDVRHSFKPMDMEEVRYGIIAFKNFANIYNLPEKKEIDSLWDEDAWKQRLSPEKGADALRKAIEENLRLRSENTRLNFSLNEYSRLCASYEESLRKAKEVEKQLSEITDIKAQAKELQEKLFESKQETLRLQKEMESYQKEKIYSENLQRVVDYTRTRYDYEQELLTLTEEQESIIKQVSFSKDFLVKGSAGTGKSLVVLKVIERLVNDGLIKENNLHLLTFGRSLSKYNVYLSKIVNVPVDVESVVNTADAFIRDCIYKNWERNINYYSKGLEEIIEALDLSESPLNSKELKQEMEFFIFANAVTEQQYCQEMIKRTGMIKPLEKQQRVAVWNYASQIIEKLESSKSGYAPFVFYKIAVGLKLGELQVKEEFKSDYILVDEVQDLTASQLIILKHCSTKNLFMTGDSDQTIRLPGFSWKMAGISVVGRTRNLHTNFRNTDQLNTLAESYRKTIPGMDIENKPVTFRLGPEPELYFVSGKEDALDRIMNSVEYCVRQLGYEPDNICIVSSNKIFSSEKSKHLEKINMIAQEKLGVPVLDVSSKDFDFDSKGVRYSTIQHAKGLDFPVVLYYIDNEYFNANSYNDEICDKMNRTVIYTAITRAVDYLQVFVNEKIDIPAVNDFVSLFKKESN